MTYATPTRARALYASWLARHPELAAKHELTRRAICAEAWRRCVTAAARGDNSFRMTADDYQTVMARMVSQVRKQRFGLGLTDGVAEWWSQIQGIAAEVGWDAPRHLFFVAERKQQEAA